MPNDEQTHRDRLIDEIAGLIRLTDVSPEKQEEIKERLKVSSTALLSEILDTEVVQTAVKISEARRRVEARFNPMMRARPTRNWAAA